jgi:hypothetical protein
MVNRRLGCSLVNCFYVIQSLLKWIHNVHVLPWNVDIVDLTISECTSIQPNHFSLGEPTFIFICICSIFFGCYHVLCDIKVCMIMLYFCLYTWECSFPMYTWYLVIGYIVLAHKDSFCKSFQSMFNNFIFYFVSYSSAATRRVLSSFLLCCYVHVIQPLLLSTY